MIQQAPLLDVVLRPAPPLPPRALLGILGLVAAANAAFAAGFVLRGAWPMLPFMGADIALLAWAFRASTEAAMREERIVLTPALLRIFRRAPRTPPSEVSFNPYWVRVDVEERAGRAAQLTLWSHGRGVPVGSFLPPAEHAGIAERLKAALRAAREARP
jgi:uncharacterized membrane protein